MPSESPPTSPSTHEPSAVGAAMWANDQASQRAGMQLEEVRSDYARLSMQVREDMVNGLGVCHGGYLFLLADSAMAFASNSDNRVALASGGAIDFLSPARLGETLTAEAHNQVSGRRTGITDVVVTAADGRRVALLRGKTTKRPETILPEH